MTHDPNVKIIESATRDDVLQGDHVSWAHTEKVHDVTITVRRREGVAVYRDAEGNWWTERGLWITDGEGEGITLTIRRPIVSEEESK